MPQDQYLLEQLRQRNPQALRAIYENHKDHLLTRAACLLGDTAAAEDCLHDVFVKLAADASSLRIRQLKSYLTTCITNRARDFYRRKARHDIDLGDVSEPSTDDPQPWQNLSANEDAANLLRALTQLPYEQREALVLRHHDDLTFRQIAQLQQTKTSTARSRYNIAIQKMRILLQNAGAKP